MLDSGRKLGGAAEHLIDGSEKHIWRSSFEFYSPHVIKRRSKFSKKNIQSSIGKYRKIYTKAKILRLGLTSNDKILEVTEIGFDWMINQLVDHSLEIKA